MKSRDYFNRLNILFFAMAAAQLILGTVAWFRPMADSYNEGTEEMRNVFIYLVPVFIASSLFFSLFLTRSRISNLKSESGLPGKMKGYFSILILKFAFLEGSSIFGFVCCLITGEYLFLAAGGLMILVFLTQRPGTESACRDLELDEKQSSLLRNPDAVIAYRNIFPTEPD